ncbi:hypothetical protein [Nocardia sp. NPDC019395]|uniref:phosphoribosyltransferase-like protein n=1 Tax=Nocardia sp. NPDC019395 TaxID=3154686 RepID=UPI003411CAD2
MADALQTVIGECRAPVGVFPAREVLTKGIDDFAPLDHPFAGTPGSEGLIGNIIRDVVGRKPRYDRAASYTSLDWLRRHSVRTLLLVDDYSGTGNQLVNYIDAWAGNPTIRSWHSYGLLRIRILVLAASALAIKRLQGHRFVDKIVCLEQGVGFDTAPWMDDERAAIVDLCKKYAHAPKYALGYGNSKGLLVLHHTVPNNLPNILWQLKCPKVSNWAPLFGKRTMVPKLQRELDDYRLETDPKRIAAIIQHERLGDALDAQNDPTVRILLLVLGAIQRGYRDPIKLANLLSISHVAVRVTIEACHELRLLDSENRLTDEGRRELRHALHRPVAPTWSPRRDDYDELYYPATLRGAR